MYNCFPLIGYRALEVNIFVMVSEDLATTLLTSFPVPTPVDDAPSDQGLTTAGEATDYIFARENIPL